MRMHTAVRSSGVASQVAEMVDSLAQSASVAMEHLDRAMARTKQDDKQDKDARAPWARDLTQPIWMQPSPTQSASFFGKSVLFVLITAVHVLAFLALSYLSPQMRRVAPEAIQVVTLTETSSERDILPAPKPMVTLPSFDIPIEPVVIDIAEPETAITLASSQTRTVATPSQSTTGTPKVVSSVEYIREPATQYPPAARALKQRGTVMLRALIDADGHAREVNVYRSSGYRLLDDAARTAVFSALFKPYIENGQSLPVYVFIPIEFGAA